MINYLVEEIDKPPLLKVTYTTAYTPQTNPLCINYFPAMQNNVYVKKVVNGEVVNRPQAEINSWYNISFIINSNKKQFNDLSYETFTFDNHTFLLDNKSRWYYEQLKGKNENTDVQSIQGTYLVTSININNFLAVYERKMKDLLTITEITVL